MKEDTFRKNRILAVVRGRRSAASENNQRARDSDDALNFEDEVCFVDGYHNEEGSRDTMQITENQLDMMVIPDYTSLVPRTDLDDELAKGETGAELHRVSDSEHALEGRQVTVSDFLESDSIAVKVEKPLLSMVEKMEIIDRIRSARGGRRLRNKQQLERSFEFLKQVLVEGDMKWLTPVLLAALLGAAAGGLAPFAIVYSWAQIGCYTAATLAALAGAGFASSMATNLTHNCCTHQDCVYGGRIRVDLDWESVRVVHVDGNDMEKAEIIFIPNCCPIPDPPLPLSTLPESGRAPNLV